jgi:hypothetical protein
MPARRHFFRSPSPFDRRQGTIYNRLAFLPPRPGRPARPVKERHDEPVGNQNMVSGLNKAIVIEMFWSYRKQYQEEHQIVRDNDDLDIHRRCAYTREHKLKAIDYALNT